MVVDMKQKVSKENICTSDEIKYKSQVLKNDKIDAFRKKT